MFSFRIIEVSLHMRSGLTLKARVHEITQRYIDLCDDCGDDEEIER